MRNAKRRLLVAVAAVALLAATEPASAAYTDLNCGGMVRFKVDLHAHRMKAIVMDAGWSAPWPVRVSPAAIEWRKFDTQHRIDRTTGVYERLTHNQGMAPYTQTAQCTPLGALH
jgi:hypothetical protein